MEDHPSPPPPLSAATTPIFPPPLRVPSEPLQTMKQCVVCGDFHESEAAGLMVGYHMTKLRGSVNDYVCEWCFAYFCSMCGRRFRDSTANAEPAKWLQQFLCGDCSESEGVSTDGYDRTITHLIAELKTSELLGQCRTCAIKHRNRTLFSNLQLDKRIEIVLAQSQTIPPRGPPPRPQQLPSRIQPPLLLLPQPRTITPSWTFQPRHRPPPFHRPIVNELAQRQASNPQSPTRGDP